MCVNKQDTDKFETTFNLRLNNHRKDLNKQNLLQADQQIRLSGDNFNKHKKLISI